MPALVRLVKEFPILAFALAAYLISWGAWIPMGVLGIDFNTAANLPALLNAPGMAMMLNGGFTWVAALVVILIADGKSLSRSAQPAGSAGDLAASGS
jgi:hypothetical protein